MGPPPPAHPRPATQMDVARLAGVSSTVVSYVVNDGPRQVAAETRARVERAIAQLGYRPNASARALKTGASKLIGVLVPSITNPVHAEFIDAIDLAASAAGYDVVLSATHEDPERERPVLRNLLDRGVDGLILLLGFDDPSILHLGSPSIPRVLIEHSGPAMGLSSIGPDEAQGAALATEHLIEHGHKRIAMIMGGFDPGSMRPNDGRPQGWMSAMEKHGLPTDLLERAGWSLAEGREAAHRLIAREHDRPTAIFASSDYLAMGAMRAIQESGLRVPDDIALAGYDGTALTEYITPPLTVATQRFQEMADAAVELLAEPDQTQQRLLFPLDLVVRSSCGCSPHSA